MGQQVALSLQEWTRALSQRLALDVCVHTCRWTESQRQGDASQPYARAAAVQSTYLGP